MLLERNEAVRKKRRCELVFLRNDWMLDYTDKHYKAHKNTWKQLGLSENNQNHGESSGLQTFDHQHEISQLMICQ